MEATYNVVFRRGNEELLQVVYTGVLSVIFNDSNICFEM